MRLALLVLVALLLSSMASCAAPEEVRDVAYDPRLGERGLLDLYMPDSGAAKRPTVMLIHGGSWRFGSKDAMKNTARRLARSGYVAVSINYRLLPDGAFPKAQQDCVCAYAWIRRHAAEWRIDPDRIAVLGYSAGAHLASLVGVGASSTEKLIVPDCEAAKGQTLPLPKGVVSGSGPQDMRKFYDFNEDISEWFGGTPAQVPEHYRLGSPIDHVTAKSPPYLLITDLTAKVGGVDLMRDKLLANGVEARLMTITGSLHILEHHQDPALIEAGIATETPEAWIVIEDFLRRTIGT